MGDTALRFFFFEKKEKRQVRREYGPYPSLRDGISALHTFFPCNHWTFFLAEKDKAE